MADKTFNYGYILFLSFVAALGGILFGYDTAVISGTTADVSSQFALSDRSRYRARNARELASRIEWWLEHDQERRTEARKYLGMGKEYDIHKSIDKLIQMYEDVLKQHYGS